MHAEISGGIAWSIQLPVLFINLVSAARMPSCLSKILPDVCFSFPMLSLFVSSFTQTESHPACLPSLVFLFPCNIPLLNPLVSCESILWRRRERCPRSFQSMHPCVWLCTPPPWLLMWPRPLSVPIEPLGPKLNRHRVILSQQRRAFPAGECRHCTRSADWVQINSHSLCQKTVDHRYLSLRVRPSQDHLQVIQDQLFDLFLVDRKDQSQSHRRHRPHPTHTMWQPHTVQSP